MRRTRIKGLANIPQRRKADSLPNKNDEAKEEDLNNLEVIQEDTKLIKRKVPPAKEPCTEKVLNKPKPKDIEEENVQVHNDKEISLPKSKAPNVAVNKTNEENVALSPQTTECAPDVKTQETKTDKPLPQRFSITRRKIIKPSISARATNRTVKQTTQDVPPIPEPLCLPSPPAIQKLNMSPSDGKRVIVLNNISLSDPLKIIDATNIKPPPRVNTYSNLGDTHILPPKSPQSYSVVRPDFGMYRRMDGASNSDSEYPPPPSSPSKINRSRIKAIPRLGNRKISFSASESEDESKKNYHRTRNDSVSSSVSGLPDGLSEASPRPKEFNTLIQRKCRRTDQSRKLAEARREFFQKFGCEKPDRKKLTMMDLIFYNPSTNLMSDTKSRKTKDEDTNEVEENEDNPDAVAEKTEAPPSDEENDAPAPQIKIGPDGQIILDEKSLLIENKATKRSREEIAKSKVVDSNKNATYGVYKRHKRAKDWNRTETLRFYKALNTIGTDFSLMCELFPRRSRRELKMKFKKEEKINRVLIDKALMEPCNFNFDELQHEVNMEEREIEEVERQKVDKVKTTKVRHSRKMTDSFIKDLDEETEGEKKPRKKPLKTKNKTPNEALTSPDRSQSPPPPVKTRKRKVLSIESVLDDDSDADVSDNSDDIVIKPRPTRYGRVPKVKRMYEPQSVASPLDLSTGTRQSGKHVDKSNAGALMVDTITGPSGQMVYNISMVDEQGLGTKKLITVTEYQNSDPEIEDEGETIIPIPEEYNFTIPASPESHTITQGCTVIQAYAEEDNSELLDPEEFETNKISIERESIQIDEKTPVVWNIPQDLEEKVAVDGENGQRTSVIVLQNEVIRLGQNESP